MLKLAENKPAATRAGSLSTRQRKTKDPCPDCFLHRDLCICEFIPRLDLRTKVTLIFHAKELKRTTNTGRLALKALVHSDYRVRGESPDPVDLSDLLNPQFRTLLYYPSDDAVMLTSDFLALDSRPVQLLVPDGNWRQASKVHTRHPELSAVPRVMLQAHDKSAPTLRLESKAEGMATLEAIALALGVIEGEATGHALMDVYRRKLKNTLVGRGVKP